MKITKNLDHNIKMHCSLQYLENCDNFHFVNGGGGQMIFATNAGALPTERRTENKVMLIQNMRTIFLKKKGMFRSTI